jgi:hypothetical protein
MNAGQGIQILATKESSSTGDGALTVGGGVGISKNAYVGGDLYVNGDITVTGTMSYLSTETLLIRDNLIVVNSEAVNGIDGGVLIKRSPTSATDGNVYASMFYKESTDELTFAYTTIDPGTNALSITDYVPVRCDYVRISNSSDSTHFSNGSFTTLGGAYIDKNLRVGQNITASSIYVNSNGTFTNVSSTNLIITNASCSSLHVTDTIHSSNITGGNVSVQNVTMGTLHALTASVLNASITNISSSNLLIFFHRNCCFTMRSIYIGR